MAGRGVIDAPHDDADDMTERRIAEADAWYVFGVDGVTNRLLVEE